MEILSKLMAELSSRRFFSLIVVLVLVLSLLFIHSLNYFDGIRGDFIDASNPELSSQDSIALDTGRSASTEDVAPRPQNSQPVKWRHDSLTGVKVLVIVITSASSTIAQVLVIFEHLRIKYTVRMAYQGLSDLYLEENPQYAAVVIQNLEVYNQMDDTDKALLEAYCKRYKVGIVTFVSPSVFTSRDNFPFEVNEIKLPTVFETAKTSPVLRITKSGIRINISISALKWTHFQITNPRFSGLAFVKQRGSRNENKRYCVAIHGEDENEGFPKVYLNNGFHFWMENMLFLDAIYFVSRGLLNVPIKRYILVDIDDTLRANADKQPTAADTKEMVEATKRLRQYVENFHFNLGIIGLAHEQAGPSLKKANELLIKNKDYFYWFDHTYSHPNLVSLPDPNLVKKQYDDNQRFIKTHQIPTKDYSYLVTPFHAGIYPVYKPAYDAWKTIGVSTVSTMHNTHMTALQYLPSDVRRGYMYEGIKVLPRKAYNIYTGSVNLTYTERNRILDAVRGGKTFLLLLIDLINIYMTHYVNYSHDRMGLVAFEELVRFTNQWTNLKLITVPPLELADIFFTNYPEEKDPFWTLPCDYGSQQKYWSKTNACPGKQYPDVLVVGPSRKGTSRFVHLLDTFRTPNINKVISSRLGFFTENYCNGLDWYVDQFKSRSSPDDQNKLYIDVDWKTFTDSRAPQRVFTLLPKTKLIIILNSPQEIIYQCVQEAFKLKKIKADFNSVYTQGTKESSRYAEIGNQCLRNGSYHSIFSDWLKYFSARQMLVVDQLNLQMNPTAVMNEVAAFLRFKRNFENSVWYNELTGDLCRLRETDCFKISPSSAKPINQDVTEYLHAHLAVSNSRLLQTFEREGISVPHWLYSRNLPTS